LDLAILISDQVAISVDCSHTSDAAMRYLQLLLLLLKPLVKADIPQFHML
jgi:hypothetical protein